MCTPFIVQQPHWARRDTVLTPAEVSALLHDLRQHREAQDTVELRAVLRLVIDCVVVNGDAHQVHYRPETRPWFASGVL